MKFIALLLTFALLQLHNQVQGCMQDYNNQCRRNQDCCSRNCAKGNSNWATGVCKPGNGGGSRKCLPDGSNECNTDGHCCSGHCWRGNANWASGVCKSRGGNTGKTHQRSHGGGGRSGGLVSQAEFNRAVTSNNYPTPRQDQYQGFIKGLSKGGIHTKKEAAMALAQFLHESDGLKAKEEYACQHSKCPGHYHNAGCEKHGKHYYGRGYIQLTWCYNYRDAGRALGLRDTLLNDPDLVARNEQYAWDTAFWFWKERVRKGIYGPEVKAGKFGFSTRSINGALECTGRNVDKSKKRFQIYQNVYRAFGLTGQPDERGCYN